MPALKGREVQSGGWRRATDLDHAWAALPHCVIPTCGAPLWPAWAAKGYRQHPGCGTGPLEPDAPPGPVTGGDEFMRLRAEHLQRLRDEAEPA